MTVPHPSPAEQATTLSRPWPTEPTSASITTPGAAPATAPGPAPETATEPLVCRRCGAITIPTISPGTGLHALKANCPSCGGFMHWVSKYTPAERAARREQARREAMTQLAPTEPQLRYPRMLGDSGPPPANRAEASARIPAVLTARPQWILWRGEDRIDQQTGEVKLNKVPIDPQRLTNADTTDPRTWGTFERCYATLSVALEEWELAEPEAYRGGGIGFVLTADNPYIGIDLDHCRDPETGTIAPWAQTYIRALATYSEVSPSFLISGACPRCQAPLVVRYASRDDQPFIGCSAYPQCRFTERFNTALAEALDAWHAEENWAWRELRHVEVQLIEACRERDYWKARADQQPGGPAALAPELLHRELKKLITVAHPDRWCQNQPAVDLAHQVTAALNRLREQLAVAA